MQKKKYLWDAIFAALFIGTIIFLVWKCRQGFGNIDESFYLAMPLRILQGDRLFIDEWNVAQLVSVLIYPFVSIFMAIAGSTDGMILAFRYIFTGLVSMAGLFVFVRLRKMSKPGAAFAAIFLMLYAPYGISAMGYNSLGIINLVVSGVIIATAVRWVRVQYAVAGLFFAAAVLCSPYLVILYVVYGIVSIVLSLVRKGSEDSPFKFTKWLFFTIGAAVLAAMFAVFVLSRAGLAEIIASFPNVVSDSDHMAKGVVQGLVGYAKCILLAGRISIFAYAGLAVAFAVMLIDRKRRYHRALYLGIAALLCLVLLFSFMGKDRFINFIMFPLNILPVFIVILVGDSRILRLFTALWAGGMIYTLCIYMSSNQEFYAVSSASAVANVASAVIIAIAAREVAEDFKGKILRPVVLAAALLVLISQLACLTYMRYESVFWEDRSEMTETIDEGVEKGVVTSPVNREVYENFLEAAEIIESYPVKSVMLRSFNTWGYLVLYNLRNSSYSPWIGQISGKLDDMDKLEYYYSLHPEKIPDAVYIENGYESDIGVFQKYRDYEVIELYDGWILIDGTVAK